MLPFSIADLEKAIALGDVTRRVHPSLPLYIYNYSPETQYSKKWNDVTLNCRGLILDEDYNIVARPWKKFFNLGEVELPIQFTDPVEIMDKADGSLGILYPQVYVDEETDSAYDITHAIATRGSFESEQAIHATKVWNTRYSYLNPHIGYTVLFEIVYPENRIVLDYSGMDDLILLGAVTHDGYYLSPLASVGLFTSTDPEQPDMWPGPVVEVFNYKNISEALGHMDRKNAEGYVIRSHNFMVKLKQPDYLELHRLVTNASPKTVWEQLAAGKSKSEIISAFPDEFHSYIEGMIDPLTDAYESRSYEITDAYFKAFHKVNNSVVEPTRADYAREFKKSRDARYYFLLLDDKSIRDVLWSELKPSAS